MAGFSQAIGLFGATGELGRACFDALEQQLAFTGRLRLFASSRSAEETRVYRDRPLSVEVADDADFSDLGDAILAVPADVADDLAGRLLQAGVRVWDASGHLRGHPQAVPFGQQTGDSLLIVLDDPLITVLQPLAQALQALAPLVSLDVSVMAPVSARGSAGVRELARQTGELLNGRGISTEVWPQQVAFNLLAADSTLDGQGSSARERRLLQGLARHFPATRCQARQYIVPVFYGAVIDLRWQHGEPVSRTAVMSALKRVPGCQLHDKGDPARLPSPVGQGVDNDQAWLSRLQVSDRDGLLTVLADPLRVGIVRPLLAAMMIQG